MCQALGQCRLAKTAGEHWKSEQANNGGKKPRRDRACKHLYKYLATPTTLSTSRKKKTFLLSKWQILKYQYVPCRKVSLARHVFSSSLRARSQGRSKDESSTRTSLKKWIYFLSRLFLPTYFVKSRLTLLKSNSKGPYPSSEREIKFPLSLFTFSIKCKLGIFTS